MNTNSDARHTLADAMLRAAVTDAASPDVVVARTARQWIEGDVCATCCAVLGIDVDALRAQVRVQLDGTGPMLRRPRTLAG